MNLVLIILAFCLLISILSNVAITYFLTKFHQDEKRDLHDRLMSREYQEYLYGQHTREQISNEAEIKKEQIKREKEVPKELREMLSKARQS